MTTTRRVGGGGSVTRLRGSSLRAQWSEHTFRTRERLVGGDVADDGKDRVVGREVPLVKRVQVVARNGGSVFGVPLFGRPYGWNP